MLDTEVPFVKWTVPLLSAESLAIWGCFLTFGRVWLC